MKVVEVHEDDVKELRTFTLFRPPVRSHFAMAENEENKQKELQGDDVEPKSDAMDLEASLVRLVLPSHSLAHSS